ncbi:putative Retrotransposon protein [Hibiscus syriacus]|uniref:Retrotransposon protein n=1 Tax=Hibiscus syriacus TaxID=106335 RepID=A0A6A2ZWR1_HIBSY|nr:putative Retrotransposon protein [Hibiscus syriacus]
MGGCFSKKKDSASHHNTQPQLPPQPKPKAAPLSSAVTPLAAETNLNAGAEPEIHRVTEEQRQTLPSTAAKPPQSTENEPASSASTEGGVCNINTTAMRTSSCTKEEVDAILIQCGRLSRSESSGKTPSSRKYSGSKRNYDFDCENDNEIAGATSANYSSRKKGNEGLHEDDDRPRRRSSSRSSSQGRRRTPSREREQQQQQQQRSGSRERSSGGTGGRRVSRSPGRRSENTESTNGNNAASGTNSNRLWKMISVPPTVSSLAMDKSMNGVEAAANPVKRTSVKRNVEESPARTAASPRSQSPARTNNAKGCNENQQQPVLSRNSSRKAEHSPYRRNPLSEIDPNSLAYPQQSSATKGQGGTKKPNVKGTNVSGTVKEATMVEDGKIRAPSKAGADDLKPQPLTRSQSSRRSRDMDFNPETLLNPIPSSYTSLLLEDIQNFHQKNNTQLSLPPCVTKACSILEAVADLNSTTSSNISVIGKKMIETGDPFVESEVVGSDHLMEPSFHKYVTVRRGGGGDMEEQESSGSNSVVSSGQQHWGFPGESSWEPNSADSTDRWTSRTKGGRQEDYSTPLGLQRHAMT